MIIYNCLKIMDRLNSGSGIWMCVIKQSANKYKLFQQNIGDGGLKQKKEGWSRWKRVIEFIWKSVER